MIIALIILPMIFSIPTAIAWYLWRKNLAVTSVFGLFLSFILTIYTYNLPDSTISYPWIPQLGISFTFILDYLSKTMGLLTAFIAFLIGVYSLEYMKHDYRLGWYWFFFNTFTSSMLLVVYSDNLLSLLIGWEGLGLASWALIGHWFRDDDELSYVGEIGRRVWKLKMFWSPSFSAWRAISTIRIGDMPMFFAIAVIFALTQNLNVSSMDWHTVFKDLGFASSIVLLALMMGPFTKSAQLPFSEWLMTAMTGPTTVSALLHSATMVAAGAYLFMRLSWYIEPWNIHELEFAYTLILFLGLSSSLYGALVALACRERKVLLASSTLSSLGIMFAVTSLSFWFGRIAIILAFLYLVVHALAKATLFLVAGHLIHATHNRFHCKVNFRKMPSAFIATLIATLCLSGIPPFTAYWVKSGMEELLHHLEEFGYYPLALFLLTSVIYSAFLAKFLSLNFLKGREVEIYTHREILMQTSYIVMCLTLLPLIVYVFREVSESSVIVGIILAIAYVLAILKPTYESRVGQFLSDRMYLMALNDLIVPSIGRAFIFLCYYFDKAVDLFAHTVIPEMFENVSNAIRSVQRKRLTKYVEFVIGLLFTILLIAGWFEWKL
ncbi:NADH-quinone oxidoreductase subunit 5 family protein [Archaeoglobus profundus]|uniref:NADH/Ubiquinone/plastoquinone (Complex I) n=1 Tax=Archaeoglobus profundus (strain DSM 5631 / JCM 9629 / NBRC 100127 / Av18) TaxID=572546 RepID=D2RET3_ARCPA|nr:NADH-quinone oxidoreductase subunit L [Archaeoglobus profundus]ADB58627.1 NADH/Ubiquinone/plastoquinone (complex I) [Archaeoglobus profundus DSM 5631]